MAQETARRHEGSLLVIGPEPPPATGMELATQALLVELRQASVSVLRVDTADPTDELGNRGRWTAHNIFLGVAHMFDVVRKCVRRDVRAVYLPIAQEFPALARDLAFVLLPRLLRKPVVIHLHGGSFCNYFQTRGRLTRRLIRGVLGGCARGIVLTEGLRPALECVLPSDRIVVVQNGLDLPDGQTGARPRGDEVTALLLSSLFPDKGLYVFIEAVALAREQQPKLRGVIAGTWPSPEIEAAARRLVTERSLEDSIVFFGPVHGAQKTELLASSDLFCLPSSYQPEGQPLVIIEAMAAGLPVVATRWRGIPETVVDGETGLLVDSAEPSSIAEQLVLLAGDPEARRRLGENGRARYRRLYTQKAFGERMLDALSPFLNSRSEPAPIHQTAHESRARG